LQVPRAPAGAKPVQLLVDSTGLRLCGPGEWLTEKHGTRQRLPWRKLHVGVDAATGHILAVELTTHDVDNGSQVAPLLDPIDRPVAAFTGDGAYDRDDVYAEVAVRHPKAAVVVPPRSNAVPTSTAQTEPSQRDQLLAVIAERGRKGWQITVYSCRALVEADINRWKQGTGGALRSRTDGRQTTEAAIAASVLIRMLDLGRPDYVRVG
jgi:hypothetical protein